jgi:competence/damage-inducible protein CinA-like protein
MTAEIISVGTELLLGQIVDTDSAFLSRTLADLGINLYRKGTVGDNFARVVAMIREARERADLLIFCGGLGPTEDDLTKEAAAEAFGEELVMDEAAAEHLRDIFRRRGAVMVESNLKQALVFRNGRGIPNPNGTAPGALLERDGQTVVCLPGPPRELVPMVSDFLVPYLSERLGSARQVLRSRVLRIIGIGESAMEAKIRDLLHGENPTIAPLAHLGEAQLRITARAATEEIADALIAPVERALRERLGADIYGADEETMESVVIERLREQGRTVATAEAVTGGLLAARLSAVEASAAPFPGGWVSASVEASETLLGVPESLIQQYGMASAPVAEAFAAAARRQLGADFGLAATGLTGPGSGTAEKPVGLVFIALAEEGGVTSRRYQFPGRPEEVRQRAALTALDYLRRALDGPGR